MKLDRDMGYFAVKLYFFTWLVVWGWGNVYRSKRVLRFDFGQDAGVHRCRVAYVSDFKTTDLYIYRVFQPWKWICNSEHLAVRFGKEESGSCWEMMAWRSSLFGSHYYG